jgi:hypothetical protein
MSRGKARRSEYTPLTYYASAKDLRAAGQVVAFSHVHYCHDRGRPHASARCRYTHAGGAQLAVIAPSILQSSRLRRGVSGAGATVVR